MYTKQSQLATLCIICHNIKSCLKSTWVACLDSGDWIVFPFWLFLYLFCTFMLDILNQQYSASQLAQRSFALPDFLCSSQISSQHQLGKNWGKIEVTQCWAEAPAVLAALMTSCRFFWAANQPSNYAILPFINLC